MNVNLDFASVLQVVVAGVLLAIGKTVYNTSVIVAQLVQKLDDHTKQDEKNFNELKQLGRASRRAAKRSR